MKKCEFSGTVALLRVISLKFHVWRVSSPQPPPPRLELKFRYNENPTFDTTLAAHCVRNIIIK